MKTITNFLFIFAAALLIVSCSSEPVFVKAEDLCTPEYKKKEVITEGVLRVPSSFYTMGSTVTLMLVASNKVNVPSIVFLNYNNNKEKKNMIEPLKDNFSEEDIKIYDNDGNLVQLGEKVRITGELTGGSKDYCELWVHKLEKAK